MPDFRTALQGFERRASSLRKLADGLSRMPTLEQKRQAIVGLNEEFSKMECDCFYMK
jgi:hypothetical protein